MVEFDLNPNVSSADYERAGPSPELQPDDRPRDASTSPISVARSALDDAVPGARLHAEETDRPETAAGTPRAFEIAAAMLARHDPAPEVALVLASGGEFEKYSRFDPFQDILLGVSSAPSSSISTATEIWT